MVLILTTGIKFELIVGIVAVAVVMIVVLTYFVGLVRPLAKNEVKLLILVCLYLGSQLVSLYVIFFCLYF